MSRLAPTTSPATTQPFCAPFSRSSRVSLRVSMPAMPCFFHSMQEIGQAALAAPVGDSSRHRLHHQRFRLDAVRLHVFGVDAVVADLRIRQRDDLPAVARIGEDFLVAGHGRVENDLTDCHAWGADGMTVKDVPSARTSAAGGRDGAKALDMMKAGANLWIMPYRPSAAPRRTNPPAKGATPHYGHLATASFSTRKSNQAEAIFA